MKLNSSNSNPDINSFLTKKLPVHLQFDWDQQWGDLIVIRLENSPDKGDTYEKFKISIETDDIVDFSSFKKGKEILLKYKIKV